MVSDKFYVVFWFKDGVIMNLEEYVFFDDVKCYVMENMKLYCLFGIVDFVFVCGEDGVEYMWFF